MFMFVTCKLSVKKSDKNPAIPVDPANPVESG